MDFEYAFKYIFFFFGYFLGFKIKFYSVIIKKKRVSSRIFPDNQISKEKYPNNLLQMSLNNLLKNKN